MHRHSHRTAIRRARGLLVLLAIALAVPLPGRAHTTSENAFFDSFDTPGPLAGTKVSDPWQVSGGDWLVVPQTGQDAPALGDQNYVLLQNTKTATPTEPIAFVRGRVYRELTAEVTGAFYDQPSQPLGDPAPNSSLCLTFRAPITEGIADRDNLYLYCAQVTGVSNDTPTGKMLVLFKRVGRSYFILANQIVHTWTDFNRPHNYKVVMGAGRIQAYFDGRLVIDHTDRASGDVPIPQDWFPGVPFESGAVGVRTSSARAWFDNFKVVGNDASEGRAAAVTTFAEFGNSNPQVRRGTSVDPLSAGKQFGTPTLDTGFVYHDHDSFDDAAMRSIDNPNGGQPSVGANIRVAGSNGTTTASVSLSGVNSGLVDPNGIVQVLLDAGSVDATASASCTKTSSAVAFGRATVTVVIKGSELKTPTGGRPLPDTVIGPIPLLSGYAPNTVILSGNTPMRYEVLAHAVTTMTAPRRASVSALRISVQTTPIAEQQFRGTFTPGLEINVGHVVASRYCP